MIAIDSTCTIKRFFLKQTNKASRGEKELIKMIKKLPNDYKPYLVT